VIELSPHLIASVVLLVLLLLWFLNGILFGPVLRVLDQRRDVVESAARDASEAERKIHALEEEYDRALREARREAKALFLKAQEEAVAEEKEIVGRAQAQADTLLDKALASLEKEADTARDQLRSMAEELSRQITTKILGRSV